MRRTKRTGGSTAGSLLSKSAPSATRIRPWIEQGDIRDALTAAGVTQMPGEDALGDAAFEATLAAQRTIGHLRSPSLPDLDAVADALGRIESGCAGAAQAILDRLPAQTLTSEDDVAAELAERLGRSTDSVLVALRGAVAASMTDGRRVGDVLGLGGAPPVVGTAAPQPVADFDRAANHGLTEMLLAIDRLCACAGAARAQFEAGRRREKSSRTLPEERNPAREFAFELIRFFGASTGRSLSFSRQLVGPERKDQPAGPLVRYLELLFDRARAKLAADAEHKDLARAREWSPSAEALGAWIQQYRKSGPEMQ